jgi:hypothetical protein
MYKPSLAVVVSSLSALSYQVSANEVVNIDKSKVSSDLSMAMKEQLSQVEPSQIIEGNFMQFCNTLKIDNEELNIDIEVYLATTKSSDSSNAKIKTDIVAKNCHNACYNNCHGSRSWR